MWSLVEEEIDHGLLIVDMNAVSLQVVAKDSSDAFWRFKFGLLRVLWTSQELQLLVRIILQNLHSDRDIAHHQLDKLLLRVWLQILSEHFYRLILVKFRHFNIAYLKSIIFNHRYDFTTVYVNIRFDQNKAFLQILANAALRMKSFPSELISISRYFKLP